MSYNGHERPDPEDVAYLRSMINRYGLETVREFYINTDVLGMTPSEVDEFIDWMLKEETQH